MSDVEKIVQLRNDGLTIREIQRALNISSPSVVHYHLKRSECVFRSKKDLESEILDLKEERRMLIEKLYGKKE
jgi:orotate phosphoribosyltransferase-like protein